MVHASHTCSFDTPLLLSFVIQYTCSTLKEFPLESMLGFCDIVLTEGLGQTVEETESGIVSRSESESNRESGIESRVRIELRLVSN